MVFFCQRNCYASEFVTSVGSCKPSKAEYINNGKKEVIDCYEVTFEDTVFFPEGGGQPYDTGSVNGIPVLKVLRKGNHAVHYILKPLEEGGNVTQKIDWDRRFDHMQQHSAQHLITAIADKEFNFNTVSWTLGEKVSSIDLETPKITIDQLQQLEEFVNEKIRNRVPVLVQEYDSQDPKLKEVRTRGLPDDVEGPVRVVTIKDLDANMCCGTHVSNLSDLQTIKILYCEKGKGGKTLLYFVAGKRVLKYLDECVERERKLNKILNSNPNEHGNLVEKCKKDLKQCAKSLSDALRDVARLEAFKFNQLSPRPKLFFHHRRDGNAEYFGAIISYLDDDNVLKVLIGGEEVGPGVLIIQGNLTDVNTIADGVCKILEGKGGGKTRYTAKIAKPSKRNEAMKYIKEALPHLFEC